MGSRCKRMKIRSSRSFCQPAEAKPLFGVSSEGAAAKPIGESKGGFGDGLFSNTNGEGAPKVPFSGGSNLPAFNFGVPANEAIRNKTIQLKARRLLSAVYKCNACGLCFDRQEVMFKHLNNCLPSKKITRILCVCGLQFDKDNYDYHCEVHRKFAMLKPTNITIEDDKDIDVGGMVKKFMHDEQDTVGAEDKFKLKADALEDKHAAEETSIFTKNKSCVVYRCNCRLCFERPEFLLSHLNNCDPGEKITRIHCMCGLEFDRQNYDYHCEVHRKFTMLQVKRITVNDDEIIHISGMWQEFVKDDERKAAKGTKEAQVQTVDLKAPFVKNPASENGFNESGTFEHLLGNKIVKAVIDTIESGIDDKECQTKITIIIAKASEITVEYPDKTNTGDKNNKVTNIRKSETTASQKAADNTTNSITAPTEGHHNATYNGDASNIVPNENTAPTRPENKAIKSSDAADDETNEVTELNINDYQKNSDKTRNEISAPTLPISANKAINGPETTDVGSYEITELIDRSNKIKNNQENSEISTNETFAPTLLVNKAIHNPEPKDSETNVIIEPTDLPNKTHDNQKNSEISTNETFAPTPTIPVNENRNNSESTDSGTNVIIETTDRPNKMNDNEENSDISTNETSALTPPKPKNKAIDDPNPKDGGTNIITEPIIITENSDVSTNEISTPTEPE